MILKKTLLINSCFGMVFGRSVLVIDRSNRCKFSCRHYGTLFPQDPFNKEWGKYMIVLQVAKRSLILTVLVGTKCKISHHISVPRVSWLFGVKVSNGNVEEL
jgi:hypothetical protein